MSCSWQNCAALYRGDELSRYAATREVSIRFGTVKSVGVVMMRILARMLVLASVLGGGFPTPHALGQTSPGEAIEWKPKLFILSFNRWGELSNPAEVDLAKRELAASPEIERIVIFSYGWANDGEASYASYHKLLQEMSSYRRPDERRPKLAVIGVGWDSAQSGFRKLFNDLLPFPALASLAAAVPDSLLFPVSFWSKAATADRIGFGGLRQALNEIFEYAYPGGEGTPDIFLAGHSFGTRIISQLMQDKLVVFPVHADPFVAAEYVRGAMLLQPAMAGPGLHLDADYPLLVTQSEHDHAVGGLFPMANLLVNTSTFTSFEAVFRYQIFDFAGQAVEKSTSLGAAGVDRAEALGGRGKTVPGSFVRTVAKVAGRSGYMLIRGIGEIASVPVAMLSGVITTPVLYLYAQGRGLLTHPGNHVMDTLAQLPLVEVGVAGLDSLMGREIPWGRRGKGFLNLGALNESIGRLYTPAVFADIPSEIFTPEDLAAARTQEGCGLPRCSGVMLVDSTDIIEVGSFGVSYNEPKFDFTLGWLDPLGSHSDYRNEHVVRMMANFFDSAAAHARARREAQPGSSE